MTPAFRALGCSALLATLSACSTLTRPANPGVADVPAPAGLPPFAQVDDGLDRCRQPTAAGFAAAERLGIRTVVNLRSAHTGRPLPAGTGLRCVEIPCHPWSMGDDDVAAFLAVATDPALRPDLVHCAEGHERTGLAVAS